MGKPWDIKVDDGAVVKLSGKTFKSIMKELRAARKITATAPLVAVTNESGTALSLRNEKEADFVEISGSDLGGGVYAGKWYKWDGTNFVNMGDCRVKKV